MGKYSDLADSSIERKVGEGMPEAEAIVSMQNESQYQIWVYDKQIKEITDRFGNEMPEDWAKNIEAFENGKNEERAWIAELEEKKNG